jgi:hypothetical protein
MGFLNSAICGRDHRADRSFRGFSAPRAQHNAESSDRRGDSVTAIVPRSIPQWYGVASSRTNFGKLKGASKSMIPAPRFDLKFLIQVARVTQELQIGGTGFDRDDAGSPKRQPLRSD